MGERNFHLHGNSFNRRAIGTEYETLACEYLIRHGYQILCRNFRCRQGEIDIIARDRDYLVFIEVKYRRDEHEGDPAEAVDARKQAIAAECDAKAQTDAEAAAKAADDANAEARAALDKECEQAAAAMTAAAKQHEAEWTAELVRRALAQEAAQ